MNKNMFVCFLWIFLGFGGFPPPHPRRQSKFPFRGNKYRKIKICIDCLRCFAILRILGVLNGPPPIPIPGVSQGSLRGKKD